jgi:WS/DGAT/MGAT family acyltransferase
MHKQHMNPLDAVWLMMESADTPMHLGVLATFRKPRNSPANWLSSLAAGMREFRKPVAPWNCHLTGNLGNPFTPQLIEARNFELDYHFRHTALPRPGGERELGVVVSLLHSNALDRSRPLWEFHLIEGLEGDRFAFYVKVHKALVDDVNGIPMILNLLSRSARKRNMLPLWSQPLGKGGQDSQPESTGFDLRSGVATVSEALGSVGQAVSGLLSNPFKRGEGGSFLVPAGTPRSTLNRRINSQRRIATQQFEQKRIERLADATDSTLNELLAYLCGSLLRRFFKEYNALPDDSLIGAVPVSLLERSERLPGNAIAGIRVALGTHIGDPLARLKAVKRSVKKARRDRVSLPEHAITPYVMMRAAPIYASQTPVVGQFVPPLFNLGVSSTPGPDKPMYYNGSRMEEIYHISPLMQFSALSIDCVSYAGTLNIGFTGARDTLPHLQRMAVYMGKAVDELEELMLTAGGAK